MNQPTVPNLFHFYLTYLNLIPIDYINRVKFVDYLKLYQRVSSYPGAGL